MLYFIRHGQTDANLNAVNAGGEADIPLNATGRLQAESFAETNREFLQSVTRFYVSPMIRAQETARIIINTSDARAGTETIDHLREWLLGQWSGRPYHETDHLFSELATPPGGEPFSIFSSRVMNALHHISHRDDERALVIAHGGIWFAYAKHAQHDTNLIDNCHQMEMCRITLRAFPADNSSN